MWQFAGPDNYTQPHAARFQPGAAAAAGRRADSRDGAAHDRRTRLARQRAADGTLPPRFLLERRDRRTAGQGPESPRRLLRRQRFGRLQRRRRRRLRPASASSAAASAARASASPAVRVPSRPAATSACCKPHKSSATSTSNIAALGDSVEQLQAAYDAGRIDRFQVDLARQALYNAQSQLLNSEAVYEQYASTISSCSTACRPTSPIKIADPMLDSFNLLDPDLAAAADSRDRRAHGAARGRRRPPSPAAPGRTARRCRPSRHRSRNRSRRRRISTTLVAERPRNLAQSRKSGLAAAQKDLRQLRGSTTASGATSLRAAWPNAKMPRGRDRSRLC